MTKTSIFGQHEVKQVEKKPIEFVKHLGQVDCEFLQPSNKASDFKNIVLLELGYTEELDLMWAYSCSPNSGILYLGHWNDGIVKTS